MAHPTLAGDEEPATLGKVRVSVFTPLELDKPRRLRFDIEACCDMEDLTGLSLGEIVRRLRTVHVKTTRDALWAGLKHEDSTLTVQGVKDIMQTYLDNGGKFITIANALDEAISKSTPLHSGSAGGNAKPKAAAK